MSVDLSFLTQPVATLIAGIVGLFVIAYQANRGFKNLIKSQEHKGILDREARLHIYELAQQQRNEEKLEKAKKLAAAIQGEIESLAPRYASFGMALRMSATKNREKEEDGDPFRLQSIDIEKFDTPILESQISDIGLLSPSLIRDISLVYGKSAHKFKVVDMGNYETVIKHYDKIASSYELLSDECFSLAERLLMFIEDREKVDNAGVRAASDQVGS